MRLELGVVRVRRCGRLAENMRLELGVVGFKRCGRLTEKMRLEWPWLVLVYPPHSLPTQVLVASSYTRT